MPHKFFCKACKDSKTELVTVVDNGLGIQQEYRTQPCSVCCSPVSMVPVEPEVWAGPERKRKHGEKVRK